MTTENEERIKRAVREAYGDIARRSLEEMAVMEGARSAPATCCRRDRAEARCGTPSEAAAGGGCSATRLYSEDELAGLPESVTGVTLGCGNPTAIAELRLGEVVLDLGSGGGIDCFLAAAKVGPHGRVIGLDMTPEMVRLARRNAKKAGVDNVEFRYGEMEEIPLPDSSVDAIISNCVINLSPDKDAVFREAYRVLRPGGRVSISDIVIDGELPAEIRGRMDAWAGCVAGALDESDYLGKIRAAGFGEIEVVSRDYARISESEGDGGIREMMIEAGYAQDRLDRTVASVRVRARKPE